MGFYITLLITGAGSLAALLNPFYGLLAYVIFALIKPDSLWSYNVPAGNYSRILGVCMLLGWMIRGFGSWKLGKAWAILLCFLLHVGWVAFGTVFITTNMEKGLYMLDILVKILLPFMVGLTSVKSIHQLKILAFTIVGAIAFLAFELNHAYYVRNINLFLGEFLTMDNNTVGIMLAPAAGFMMYFVLESKSWLARIFCGGSLLLLINAICFSNSRGTMLATLITGLMTFVLMPKRPIHFVIFALVIAAGVRLAGTETLERFWMAFADEETRDYSAQSRLDIWGNALSVMFNNPVTGIGPGKWDLEASRYGWTEGKQVHSTWLQNGAEGGLFGFTIYIAFYFITIARMLRICLAPTEAEKLRPSLISLARMVTASLCGFVFAAQFVTAWSLEMPYYMVMIGALVLKLRESTPPEIEDHYWPGDEEYYEHYEDYLEEPMMA